MVDPLADLARRPVSRCFPCRAARALLASALVLLLTSAVMYAVDMPKREAEILAFCLRVTKYGDLYEIHPCYPAWRAPSR